MISFFEDILNQRWVIVTPSDGVTLIAVGGNFNRTWGSFDQPIKLTRSVTKADIIIVNK